MIPLEASYRHCERVARNRARNFYYSFVLLPRPKRLAMCAIYAFMRYCDDLSDEPGMAARQRFEAIQRWRADLDAAFRDGAPDHPLWPAFHDTVARFRIPRQYFYDMIDGVSSDLEPRRIETFDELYQYCYRVASVVGMTVIHIFGFEDPKALPLAEKCGIAFQLTNILRDVREDADLGRVYLPSEDLRRFSVDSAVLSQSAPTPAFTELMRFEARRARQYYDESRPLLDLVEPGSRSSLWALIEIYSRLLGRIEASGYDVLSRRIRVSTPGKAGIVLRAFLRGK